MQYDKLLLQAEVFAREGDGWSKERWASSDRLIFGSGNFWQHNLVLNRTAGYRAGPRNPPPPGRYLVRLYLDRKGELGRDFRKEMGWEEFVGEVETRWPEGYRAMTAIRFPQR